jgi:hypothetical protein
MSKYVCQNCRVLIDDMEYQKYPECDTCEIYEKVKKHDPVERTDKLIKDIAERVR